MAQCVRADRLSVPHDLRSGRSTLAFALAEPRKTLTSSPQFAYRSCAPQQHKTSRPARKNRPYDRDESGPSLCDELHEITPYRFKVRLARGRRWRPDHVHDLARESVGTHPARSRKKRPPRAGTRCRIASSPGSRPSPRPAPGITNKNRMVSIHRPFRASIDSIPRSRASCPSRGLLAALPGGSAGLAAARLRRRAALEAALSRSK